MKLPSKLEFKYIKHIPYKIIDWIGSVSSLVVHTLLFLGSFALLGLGIEASKVLLVLTTIVSLEAIYLSIFIQMTVNRNTQSLVEVEEDIDEIQEEVQDLGEDVEEIQEGLVEITEDDTEEQKQDKQTMMLLGRMETQLQKLMMEIEILKNTKKDGLKKDSGALIPTPGQ